LRVIGTDEKHRKLAAPWQLYVPEILAAISKRIGVAGPSKNSKFHAFSQLTTVNGAEGE
jgi:hypothetical protein